jgi:hypothetical protein
VAASPQGEGPAGFIVNRTETTSALPGVSIPLTHFVSFLKVPNGAYTLQPYMHVYADCVRMFDGDRQEEMHDRSVESVNDGSGSNRMCLVDI